MVPTFGDGSMCKHGREGVHFVFLLLIIITKEKSTDMDSLLFTTLMGTLSIARFSVILVSTSVWVSFTCLVCLLPAWRSIL